MSRKRRWLSCFVKLVRVTNALWGNCASNTARICDCSRNGHSILKSESERMRQIWFNKRCCRQSAISRNSRASTRPNSSLGCRSFTNVTHCIGVKSECKSFFYGVY